MTKRELIKELNTRTDIPKGTCLAVVDEIISIITDRIKNRDKIVLDKLFTLDSKDVEGHIGHNPRTGEQMFIEGYRKPTCKFNKKFKDIINGKI